MNSSLTLRPSAALHEAKVVSVGRLPPADQASVRGDEFDMIAITKPPRLGQRQGILSIPAVRLWFFGLFGRVVCE